MHKLSNCKLTSPDMICSCKPRWHTCHRTHGDNSTNFLIPCMHTYNYILHIYTHILEELGADHNGITHEDNDGGGHENESSRNPGCPVLIWV